MSRDYYNSEGYADPTLFPIIREETEVEKKHAFLIKMCRFVIYESGFELVGRIVMRHRDSGRVFR